MRGLQLSETVFKESQDLEGIDESQELVFPLA